MAPWSAESDRRLLIAIITVLSPSPPKWDAVVNLMGDGYTAEAVRQRYQKLKKGAPLELNKVNGMDKTSDPSTPSSRKRKSKKKDAEDGTAVEPEEGGTPSKRQKVKMEPVEDDEEQTI